jgi:hypothetical protein
LLLAWALVLWGTLLLGSTAMHALEEGFRPALLAVVPVRGAPGWAWGNVVAMGMAAVVWPLAVAVVLMMRRTPSRE